MYQKEHPAAQKIKFWTKNQKLSYQWGFWFSFVHQILKPIRLLFCKDSFCPIIYRWSSGNFPGGGTFFRASPSGKVKKKSHPPINIFFSSGKKTELTKKYGVGTFFWASLRKKSEKKVPPPWDFSRGLPVPMPKLYITLLSRDSKTKKVRHQHPHQNKKKVFGYKSEILIKYKRIKWTPSRKASHLLPGW